MSTDQEAEGGSPLEPVPMQAVPPPERRTRAGRNLPAAIGVGLGLRYYTPIGPIRVDVAVPTKKRSGDDDFELYIGLGQAF